MRAWQKRIHTLNVLGAGERERVENLIDQGKREEKKIGVFGSGGHTSLLLAATDLRDLKPVIFDNDVSKWGDRFEGLEVLPPRLIPERGLDVVLISSQSFEDEIYQQLSGMNLDGVEIVRIHG